MSVAGISADQCVEFKVGGIHLSDNFKTWMKWISTFLFLFAGAILSMRLEISQYGFIAFLLGHAILTYLFIRTRDMPMLVQNAAFLLIDINGIYRWFFA